MTKKILITGGAGFIGSHLVDACLARGHYVKVLDDFSTGQASNLSSHEKLTVVQGSILDLDVCCENARNVDIIFHLAAKTSVPDSVNNPLTCYATNIRGTYNVLEAARNNQVPFVVFSSSAAVYGPHEGHCDEHTTPCNPLSPYGTSKHMGEILCKEYGKLYGIKSVGLRYFNVYGPRQRADLPHAAFVASVRHAMLHNQPITLYGNGLQQRNFVPIDTVVHANIMLAQHLPNHSWYGEPFNVASPQSQTLLDFIKKLHAEFPRYDLNNLQFAPARSADISYSAARCEKYNAILHNL
jgi:nucleoside-diphosphate-sugar epimerase